MFKLNLSEKEINIVITALGEMPCKIVYETVNNINEQISVQRNNGNKEKVDDLM